MGNMHLQGLKSLKIQTIYSFKSYYYRYNNNNYYYYSCC